MLVLSFSFILKLSCKLQLLNCFLIKTWNYTCRQQPLKVPCPKEVSETTNFNIFSHLYMQVFSFFPFRSLYLSKIVRNIIYLPNFYSVIVYEYSKLGSVCISSQSTCSPHPLPQKTNLLVALLE